MIVKGAITLRCPWDLKKLVTQEGGNLVCPVCGYIHTEASQQGGESGK